MTDKELRRLSRAELLEMLLMLKKENENLKMQLNDVFAAADRAVQQYLENVRCMAEEDGTS